MSDIPTPITDARMEQFKLGFSRLQSPWPDFARNLERQLAEAIARRDHAEEQQEIWSGAYDELRKQRDALLEALEELLYFANSGDWHAECPIELAERAIAKAKGLAHE